MNAERTIIDQELCTKVKFMLAGGASNAEAAALLKTSSATVSRIKSAGFSAEQFRVNNDRRRDEDREKRLKKLDEAIDEVRRADAADKPIDGQIMMDLKQPEEPKAETPATDNISKLIRFQAGQMQKVLDALGQIAELLRKSGDF